MDNDERLEFSAGTGGQSLIFTSIDAIYNWIDAEQEIWSWLEPDPKVVEQYQYVVIQAVFAKRWSEAWHGLVLPGVSIAGMGCGIQAI